MDATAAGNAASTQAAAKMGKHQFVLWRTLFEIDLRYTPIKPIGKGAYGVVCSAKDASTNSKVAIKKITDAFANTTDARRTLREIKLLRHLQHENIVRLADVMRPLQPTSYKDVYLPTCRDNFSFDFEHEELGEAAIRQMIYQEACNFHPE
eukprot:PRCOL_00000317-RA